MALIWLLIGFFIGYTFQNKFNQLLVQGSNQLIRLAKYNVKCSHKWLHLYLKHRWLRMRLGLKVRQYKKYSKEEAYEIIRKIFNH
jgi:hypothetical protein